MPQQPPPHPPILNTQKSLLLTLCDFLTVTFHTLLYTRSLYPSNTFITARAYNHAVYQNRHPAVCAWINNTISSIHKVLETNSVKRVVFVIFNTGGEIMERYLFDVERFPVVEKAMAWVDFEDREERKEIEKEDIEGEETSVEEKERERERVAKEKRRFSVVDIEEQLRATLNKLIYQAARLDPLPEDCTYTVAVELRDDPSALPPLAHPQPWIPSQPSLETGAKGNSQTIGSDLGGVKSTPVRLVESGEFILETWIEEGKAKFQSSAASQSSGSQMS